MNTMRFLPLIMMALLPCLVAGQAEKPGKGPLKVAMFSGSAEYKSNQTLAEFKAYLERHHAAQCTLNIVAKDTDLPGIEQLETCDVAVIYVKRLKLPPEQLAKVKKYCESGRPIVGIRTASHAIQTWLEFDQLVLGGSYNGHFGDRLAKVAIEDAATGHPVLAGVRPFSTGGKLYKNPKLADDVTLLLTATTDQASEPVAWARQHKGGRMFYTSLGVPEDFKNEDFRRMLSNAVFWAAERDPIAPD